MHSSERRDDFHFYHWDATLTRCNDIIRSYAANERCGLMLQLYSGYSGSNCRMHDWGSWLIKYSHCPAVSFVLIPCGVQVEYHSILAWIMSWSLMAPEDICMHKGSLGKGHLRLPISLLGLIKPEVCKVSWFNFSRQPHLLLNGEGKQLLHTYCCTRKRRENCCIWLEHVTLLENLSHRGKAYMHCISNETCTTSIYSKLPLIHVLYVLEAALSSSGCWQISLIWRLPFLKITCLGSRLSLYECHTECAYWGWLQCCCSDIAGLKTDFDDRLRGSAMSDQSLMHAWFWNRTRPAMKDPCRRPMYLPIYQNLSSEPVQGSGLVSPSPGTYL